MRPAILCASIRPVDSFHDMIPAVDLLRGYASDYLTADKGCDAGSILKLAAEQGQITVISPRSDRIDRRDYDTHIYKERHLVENVFQKYKIYRKISTGLMNSFKILFSNPTLTAIREGLTFSLPIIVVGTMAVLVNSFPLPGYQELMVSIFGASWKSLGGYIWNGTLGFLSVIMTISISNSLSEHYNSANSASRINPSIVSLVAVASLLVTMEPGTLFTRPGAQEGGGGALPSIWLGVHGLLWATVIALSSGYIFRFLLRFKSLRVVLNSSSGDTTISQAMDTLISGVLTIAFFAAIKAATRALGIDDINAYIYQLIYLPFSNMGGTMLETATIYTLARHLLWFAGIHGSNVLEPIMTELYLPGLAANQASIAQGLIPTHIFTKQFFDCYTSIGGSGSTMGLLIACLLRHRDGGSRKIARISIVPAAFNINEILLFGLPVVLNPVFFIPFLLVPVIQTTVAYLANAAGLVPLTTNEVAWNIPIIISGYMATGSINGIILQIICLAMSAIIYLPFVALDNWLKAEQFDKTFKKLIQVTSTGEVADKGPRFLSSPDTVGSLARFLAQDLEKGLADNQFHLVYQPQVDSRSGRVYGVEALLRWQHPHIGPVPPPVFIGLAEDSGFINKLGLWILEDACRQTSEWIKIPGANDVVVSVNVSAKQLDDPELPDKTFELLKKHNVPVGNVKIEVTESIAIGGHDGHRVLSRFSELGFKLAIDDFGMGHTSLSYLKEFEVNSLKIDSILSRDVLVSRSSREIIATIAELCRSLDIQLIAEFVEDEAHLLQLRQLGCFNIQGYFYSPPLPPDKCLDFILVPHQAYGDIDPEEMKTSLRPPDPAPAGVKI